MALATTLWNSPTMACTPLFRERGNGVDAGGRVTFGILENQFERLTTHTSRRIYGLHRDFNARSQLPARPNRSGVR